MYKPRGMLLCEEGIPHRGGVAAYESQISEEVDEVSQSEDHRRVEAVEEVKKEMRATVEYVKKERHCNNWSSEQGKELPQHFKKMVEEKTELNIDDDFRRKSERSIGGERNSGQEALCWQIVRREEGGRRLRADTSLKIL